MKMKKTSRSERIGFEIKEGSLELVLPAFIKDKNLDRVESTDEKLKYFNLFRKYKKSTKELKEENLYEAKNFKSEEYMYSIFEAYYLLLMDYMEEGPFVFTRKQIKQRRKGRINWNRTISKSNMIISGGNLLYNDPYYSNNNVLYNHPVTVLYGLHLLQIEKTTGINVNLNTHYRKIIEEGKRSINAKEVLNNYRSSMYSDRQVRVFKLLEIINDSSRRLGKASSDKSLHYLENINNIWEHMLKSVLDDEYSNFKDYFPRGVYDLNIEGEAYSRPGSRIIPDIIKEYNGKLYIIDAKNYLPHINNNIPGTGDINKQMLYRFFLSKEFDDRNKYKFEDIKNIFLLPNDLKGEIIKKVGTHRFENIENDMGDIHLYQVDFDSIVESYLNKNKEVKVRILKYIMN